MSQATATERATGPPRRRERILATADRLFYDEGIHAVGIQRVVAESAVTRVTLYRHFPSKDDLISAYLERRSRVRPRPGRRDHRRAPRRPARAPSTSSATALTRDDFGAVRRGCPFINASAEFTGSHPARVHAREIRSWVTGRIEELLRRLGHRSPRSTARAADDGAHRRRRLGRPGRQPPAQRGLPRLLDQPDRGRARLSPRRASTLSAPVDTLERCRGSRGSSRTARWSPGWRPPRSASPTPTRRTRGRACGGGCAARRSPTSWSPRRATPRPTATWPG